MYTNLVSRDENCVSRDESRVSRDENLISRDAIRDCQVTFERYCILYGQRAMEELVEEINFAFMLSMGPSEEMEEIMCYLLDLGSINCGLDPAAS